MRDYQRLKKKRERGQRASSENFKKLNNELKEGNEVGRN